MADTTDITMLLKAAEAGRQGALDELMAAVYEDLERVAAKHLRLQFGSGAPSVTLEPAALVNESFMKLIRQRTKYDNRGHFFAIATRVMLRVLIDYRRHRGAKKRGGGDSHITLVLDEQLVQSGGAGPGLIEVEELAHALERLEALDARKADVVKMHVIWGLSIDEIADSLDVSRSTIERDWRFARAWLADEAGGG